MNVMSKSDKPNPCDAPLEEALISSLTELRDALEDEAPLEKRFTMRTVDLDLEPHKYEPEDVRKTRELVNASQAVFAKLLAVNVKTVQSWEQGMAPPPMACRLMDIINQNPEPWLNMLRSSAKNADQREAPC